MSRLQSSRARLTVALRKAKADAESEDIEFSDDLFDTAESEVAEGSGERAVFRSELRQEIFERDPQTRIGTLRKVVQLSDTPKDLEDLERILKEWRMSGRHVTSQTAEELVGECTLCWVVVSRLTPGRCINLGRADLAQKYVSDRMQCELCYLRDERPNVAVGLPPLKSRIQAKLDKTLQ